MELRESEASSYTELDTPIFTCRRRTCQRFWKRWDNRRSRRRIATQDSGIILCNAPTIAGRLLSCLSAITLVRYLTSLLWTLNLHPV